MGAVSSYLELQNVFKRAKEDKRVVLAVGSGINGTTAPQWRSLLNDLLGLSLSLTASSTQDFNDDRYSELIEKSYDFYGQGTIIKRLLGHEQYLSMVRKKLYENCSPREFRDYCFKMAKREGIDDPDLDQKYRLLYAVARLCLTGSIRAVINYNYDNLLEQAVEYVREAPGKESSSDFTLFPIFEDHQQAEIAKNAIPVYHVHGYLPDPRFSFRMRTSDIVLSQDEYFDTFSDMHAWQTSTQLHLLRHYTCVFIGASLNDWNMLRVLKLSHNARKSSTNFALSLTAERPQNDLKITPSEGSILDRVKSTLWNAVGVQPIFADYVEPGDREQDPYAPVTHVVRTLTTCAQ